MEERYTGAWYRWLPETFAKAYEVRVIDGVPLVNSIEEGAFLDINSTLHYKATQLAKIATLFHNKKVSNGDVFWLSDIEFWGMESIRYLARLQDIDVGIYGFLHAGSYIDSDYMAPMADIGKWVEPAWVAACDLVFMGTEFHKEFFSQERLYRKFAWPLAEKLVVTGNPWRTTEARALVERCDRDIEILFPHRPDAEKQPGEFVDLVFSAYDNRTVGKVVFTTGRAEYRSTNDLKSVERIKDLAEAGFVEILTGLNPQRYYQVCRRAKVTVSTALEETFGYAMVEAMAQGSFPLMPNRLSYPELVAYDERFLYNNEEEFHKKLAHLLTLGEDDRKDIVAYARRFDGAEDLILREILMHEDTVSD